MNLSAFLNPAQEALPQEVVISRRFRREDGTPAPFTIRPLTQMENDELVRKSTRRLKQNGQLVETLDKTEYGRRLVVAATVEPDFSHEELCRRYGTLDPLEVPGRMLLVGEFARLSDAILKLSGLDSDVEEQAKNS